MLSRSRVKMVKIYYFVINRDLKFFEGIAVNQSLSISGIQLSCLFFCGVVSVIILFDHMTDGCCHLSLELLS